MIPATNPAKDIDPTPSNEEEFVAIIDEDIYCENELKTNINVNNDPPPLLKTVADVLLDTMENYMQVKLYLSTIA